MTRLVPFRTSKHPWVRKHLAGNATECRSRNMEWFCRNRHVPTLTISLIFAFILLTQLIRRNDGRSTIPMVSILEGARELIFGYSVLEPIYIYNGLFGTFLFVCFGLIIFNRVERNFLDTV